MYIVMGSLGIPIKMCGFKNLRRLLAADSVVVAKHTAEYRSELRLPDPLSLEDLPESAGSLRADSASSVPPKRTYVPLEQETDNRSLTRLSVRRRPVKIGMRPVAGGDWFLSCFLIAARIIARRGSWSPGPDVLSSSQMQPFWVFIPAVPGAQAYLGARSECAVAPAT